MKQIYWSAAAVGIVCGILSTRVPLLAGTWLNLIFWALAGMAVGYFVTERADVRATGITYGVFLTLSFLLSGFRGSPSQLPAFTVLILILTVVGALCGWLSVFIGSRLGPKNHRV